MLDFGLAADEEKDVLDPPCEFFEVIEWLVGVFQASLAFNCGEFAIIKSGVEDGLPYAKELHGVPVS